MSYYRSRDQRRVEPEPESRREWRPVHTMPEDGREYWTLGPNGTEQKLRKQGNLYFGGAMYVYYTPTHWSPT